MANETAVVAADMFGDKPYQERARRAFPLLVRQALTQRTIHYEDLAAELGMPNARNLNYVLGSVGTSLQDLAERWKEEIPPIQCLVTNKTTGLPGEGFDTFLTDGVPSAKLSTREKRRLVNAAAARVFSYTKWFEVLAEFGLKPVKSAVEDLINSAGHGKGGEGERHRKLKEAIALDASLVDLPASMAPGETEFALPSGDSLDVLFRSPKRWVAIEVKTKEASEQEIIRGLFQCVKYLAVLEAWQGVLGKTQDIRVLLALEGELPDRLVSLRNSLGVELVESIEDQWTFS